MGERILTLVHVCVHSVVDPGPENSVLVRLGLLNLDPGPDADVEGAVVRENFVFFAKDAPVNEENAPKHCSSMVHPLARLANITSLQVASARCNQLPVHVAGVPLMC